MDGVLRLGRRALGIAWAGDVSSLLLGESMRRGGGRDEPGTWLRSLDDRGSPGRGEKLPGGRPWDRPEDEVVGCIFAEPMGGICYILTVPRTSRRGGRRLDGLEIAVRPRGQIALQALMDLGLGLGRRNMTE